MFAVNGSIVKIYIYMCTYLYQSSKKECIAADGRTQSLLSAC
jgi:hypothetical protein